MSAIAYLRHPIALLAAVSLAIGFIWYILGLPEPMPPSPLAPGEKLACVAYAPEERGVLQAPVAPEQIEADLAALEPITACVRTYRTGLGLDRVPEIAARYGLTVLQGIALGSSESENRAETARAAALAQAPSPAIRAFIAGTGVLERHALRQSELAALVQDFRARTELPVASAENARTWEDAELLAAAVDLIVLQAPLYDAPFPVPASAVAGHLVREQARIAARYPSKNVPFVEAGWPGAGRMRAAALPSPSNQARVLHDAVAASKRAKFQLSVIEGFDVRTRARHAGTAGAHWGVLTEEGRAKFAWGAAVSDYPLSSTQAMIGLLLAFIVFAAGYLAARSAGPDAPGSVAWEPVALIALGSGAFAGWAMALLPMQSHGPADWIANALLVLLAMAVPPLAAAAYVRRVPFGGFEALFNPQLRRSLNALGRIMAAVFSVVLLAAIAIGLVFALDPAARDFPFAALTGPAVSLLVLAIFNPPLGKREGVAEPAAALVLAVCAALIVFNESFWNWQALWLAASLAVLAFASRRAGVRTQS